MVVLRRGGPSASNSRMAGVTRSIVAFSSAVPVKVGADGRRAARGMRVRSRHGRAQRLSMPPAGAGFGATAGLGGPPGRLQRPSP